MDKMTEAEYAFPCPECQGGLRHLRYVTYFTWHSGQMISAPNFPAWVCDVCGQIEYDARALSWLDKLLNHDIPKRPASNARSRAHSKPGHL